MWLPGFESRAKAAFEMLVIHRLGKVAHDAVLQSAVAGRLIRVCGNEDRRNRVARIDEMPLKLNASHSGHLNVSDQAGGFRKERRRQEIGCRGECFDRVAQRPYEFLHGFSKGLIILDDRYQWMLRHRGFSVLAYRRSHRACSQLFNVGEGWQQSNAGARKRWLRRLAIRLDLGTVDLGE